MIDIRDVSELKEKILEGGGLAILFYADKHEKSEVVFRVFEKLSQTISECSRWAICCIKNLSLCRDELKIRQIPTAWFCEDGAIIRIVNLPQAQLYVQEAKNVYQAGTSAAGLAPTVLSADVLKMLEEAQRASEKGVREWLKDRPLVFVTRSNPRPDPDVIVVDENSSRERAMALRGIFSQPSLTNFLIIRGERIIELSDAPLNEETFELIESVREEAKIALDLRCHSIVKENPLMIIMKGTRDAPYCKFSKQLLAILAEAGIHEWGFFDIFTDDSVRERLKVLYDWPTYPQIYLEGKLLGGLDSIKEILKTHGKAGLQPKG